MARTSNGRFLIADLNDSEGAYVSASLPLPTTADRDENLTVYTIFPYELNEVPIFTNSLFNNSQPRIVNAVGFFPERTDVAYYADGNTVRVVAGSTLVLKVSAQQPDVLNVENGVPVIKPSSAELSYEWFINGQSTFDVSQTIGDAEIADLTRQTDTLTIGNISQLQAGTYLCVVSNDIGQVESEEITIEVLDPTSNRDPFAPFHKTNAIQNGFATDGTNGWTTLIGGTTTKPLLSREQETEAKKPTAALFGFAPGAMYPHPINLTVHGIKNFAVQNLAKAGGNYFTRDTLDYLINGGTNQAAMYQDIDLSEITDYISGRAYGSEGVRAYFGCMIGNAITRFIPTLDILGPDERNKEDFYFTSVPRLTYENFVLAGPALLEEKVTVVLQEYEGEAPVQSRLYIDDEERIVDNIVLTDTLSNLYNQANAFNDDVQPPFPTVTTIDNEVVTLPTIKGEQAKILNIYKDLYKTKQDHYAYGQYADYKDVVISKLNPRTNRIRITIRFDISTTRQNEISPDVVGNPFLDMEIWRKPYIKLAFREYRKSAFRVLQENESSQYKDRPLFEKFKQATTSHAMVTGMGLVLEPITPLTPNIRGFKNGLIKDYTDLTKRPAPINVYPLKGTISFQEAASNITGLSTILDIQGDVGVRYYRRFNDAKWHGFAGGAYNNDDKVLGAQVVIKNITTNQVLLSAEESFGEGVTEDNPNKNPKVYNFPGECTIRIQVRSKNIEKEDYPWVTVYLTNYDEQYTGQVGGRKVLHLFPTRDRLSTTAQSIDNFVHDSVIPTDSVPLKQAEQRSTGAEYVRNFQVDIPSNLIEAIFVGVRNSNFAQNISDSDIFSGFAAKIDYGSDGIVYQRVSDSEFENWG